MRHLESLEGLPYSVFLPEVIGTKPALSYGLCRCLPHRSVVKAHVARKEREVTKANLLSNRCVWKRNRIWLSGRQPQPSVKPKYIFSF